MIKTDKSGNCARRLPRASSPPLVRHGEVHEQHIHLYAPCEVNRFTSIRGLADHLDVWQAGRNIFKALANDRMAIGYAQSQWAVGSLFPG